MMTGRRRRTLPRDTPWRVFLSHTSDLRQHPARRPFAAAAEAAVVRTGHAVSDMTYFAAGDVATVEHCVRTVARSDVFVAVVGVRFGSLARGRPDVSYTELEFEVATKLRLPRLIFLIREDAPALPPPAQSIEGHARQMAFRERLCKSDLVVARVRWPAELEVAVVHALGELRVLGLQPRRMG